MQNVYMNYELQWGINLMHTGLILPFGLLMQLCFNKPQSEAPLESICLSSLSLSAAISIFSFIQISLFHILNVITDVARTKIIISLFIYSLFNFILGRLYGPKLDC